MPFSAFRLLLAASLLPILSCPRPEATHTVATPIAAFFDDLDQPPHLRELSAKDLSLSYAVPSLEHAIERLIAYAAPTTNKVTAAETAAALAAVQRLPVLAPGRIAGRPVRVTALWLQVHPGIAAAAANEAAEAQAAAAADSAEARTLRAGTIQRHPGETLGQLLHRTLPASYPDTVSRLVRYAWFQNVAGPQVFFDTRGHSEQDEQYDAVLFVLNPLDAGAYNVQALNLGSMGDLTDVISIFFADADHDGQRDLLALTECDLREEFVDGGERLTGRAAHYQTTVIYYRGLDRAGRPRYEPQHCEDLDEIATAAEVRQVLAAPPRRPKSAPKRNPRARAAK